MQNSPATSPYDAAALAAATLAAALAAAVEPGPYDVFSAMISVTLLLVLWAFEKDRTRNALQSVALGTVSGFVSLLAFGLALEALAGGGSMGGVCRAHDRQCRPNEFESAVPDTWLLATWLIVSSGIALMDIRTQRKRIGSTNLMSDIEKPQLIMDSAETHQLKKDWIVMLASTSGIMLTISLAVLTVVYTAESNPMHGWQKSVIGAFIFFASIFLVLCSNRSLSALGTLIITAGYRDKMNDSSLNDKDKDNASKAKGDTAQKAERAQRYFKIGMSFLLAAVFLSFIFLSWPTFASLFERPVQSPIPTP